MVRTPERGMQYVDFSFFLKDFDIDFPMLLTTDALSVEGC
jgi:hypothetical protein